MKKLLIVSAAVLVITGASGCVGPNYQRIIADTKDADIEVRSIYGTVIIHTRAQGSTNKLPVLKAYD